jgi:hypothetical protein
MLATMSRQKVQRAVGLLTSRYRTHSAVTSLVRQDTDVNAIKREKWTEVEVDVLPAGEHDYFERKSGQLFAIMGELLGTLAKAISAHRAASTTAELLANCWARWRRQFQLWPTRVAVTLSSG